MDWHKALKGYLTQAFAPGVLRKGKKLMEENTVGQFRYDPKLQRIEASVVLGDYFYVAQLETEIHDGSKLFGSCNCKVVGSCAHQAALVLDLLTKYRGEDLRTLRLLGSKSGHVPTVKEEVKTEDIQKMPSKAASNPRLLPWDVYGSIDTLVSTCRPSSILFAHGGTMKAAMLPDKTVSILYQENARAVQNNLGSKNSYKVLLEPVEMGITITCISCDYEGDDLCKHQHHVLTKIGGTLEEMDYFTDPAAPEYYIEHSLNNLGLDLKSWHKYFQLSITTSGYHLERKSISYFEKGWIENIIKERRIHGGEILYDYETPTERGPSSKVEYGHGVLWLEERVAVRQDIPIRFFCAEKYKRKSDLKMKDSKRSFSPHILPEDYVDLARLILDAAISVDRGRALERMQEVLLSGGEASSKLRHYLHRGIYNDESRLLDSGLSVVKIHPATLKGRFEIHPVDGVMSMTMLLFTDLKSIPVGDIVFQNTFFAASKEEIYVYDHMAVYDYLKHFIHNQTQVLVQDKAEQVAYLNYDLQRYFDVSYDESIRYTIPQLDSPKLELYLSSDKDTILFDPVLSYKEGMVKLFSEGLLWVGDKGYQVNESDKNYFKQFLRSAHVDWRELPVDDNRLVLDGAALLNDNWFTDFSNACDITDIMLHGRDTLNSYNLSSFRAKASVKIKSGIDWFEVDATLSFGDEVVFFDQWIRSIKRGEDYVVLKDGTYGMLPADWVDNVNRVLKVAEVDKGNISIPKKRFNVLDGMSVDIDSSAQSEIKAQRGLIQAYFENKKKHKVSPKVKAELRSYQNDGYQWLTFLDDTNSGGILADDMGLGKTLQVISLLARQTSDAPSLIIVPRSLIYNWAEELNKFCPSLKYIIHHGSGRVRIAEDFDEKQLVITTYDVCVRDCLWMKNVNFNYIILDESQAIKNIESKRYKAIRCLKGRSRIAMTGTPIENNTFDLYAQLSFASPGLLGTPQDFRNQFATPIDKNGDTEAAALLQKMIHPYVLRRTKLQVAKDLPSKTEQVLYCDMGSVQRKLYDQLKLKVLSDLDEVKINTPKGQMRFKILDGLLRLRQMCNAPKMVNKTMGADRNSAVKLELLMEQLKMVTPNHKVLVFSQFVSMLSIIRTNLEEDKIPYVYIDGRTKDRQAIVDQFQNDDSIKVFLISLKAGNTGLNLTAAEYVYIVDPWWNPAAEAQAIDRTHRIGQKNNVFAYRMICRDTIEEKILKLQQKKRMIASDIIKVDEDATKQLSEADLMTLLE